jgi:RNA polymerase sigma-70 factor (ECF subfamily)
VLRARTGDRDAFARLATAAISRLDAVARLITRDPERAKDAVQETLARAWRDLPGLRDPDLFDAWLRRVLIRACMDELRGVRRRQIEVVLIDVHYPAIADSSSGFADRDALERAFRHLDPDQRSLIVLYYYLDLSLAEVAAAVGIPAGTAKSRLARARETLRAALDADARPGRELAEGGLA